MIPNCPKLIFGKKIYVICVIALQKGVTYLKNYAQQNNLSIEVINEHSIVKTFDVNNGLYNDEKERVTAMRTVKKYDERIAKRKDDILGFKGSQGLISFYHNTPNNTFPIFWENDIIENNVLKVPWSPLLERDQGIEGLPERDKSTHENLSTIINEKNLKTDYSVKFSKKLINKVELYG